MATDDLRRILVAAALMALLFAAGCSVLPPADAGDRSDLTSSPPAHMPLGAQAEPAPAPPASAEIADLPFFPQDDDLCGPAALATILQAAGIDRTPEQLAPQVYLPGRQGSLQVEMLGAARRAGAVPYVLRPQAADLWQEVAAGHPVIVLQDLGTPLRARWHYAVVVGFDLPQDRITLRSGSVRRLDMTLAAFERSWSRGGRWAFVALPPPRLPVTAQETRLIAALSDFERVLPGLAPAGYEAALGVWPRSLLARLALGNAAYRQGKWSAAARHYRQATQQDPESADAWNNLAQALAQQAQREEAMAAARRAVSLGGARSATYAATLAQIEDGKP